MHTNNTGSLSFVCISIKRVVRLHEYYGRDYVTVFWNVTPCVLVGRY
jgi:hypothetical protein